MSRSNSANDFSYSNPPQEEIQVKTAVPVRRHVARGVALVVSFVVAVGLAGCSSSSSATTKVPQNLTVAFSQETVDLNPYGSADAQQGLRVVDNQIFDTLVTQNTKTNTYVPSLATKWSQPNSLTWLFTLRKAKFQNGAPVTAADVVADIKFLAASASPLSSLWSSLGTVSADSTSVVRITTKTPVGTMLANLSLLEIAPASDITKPDFGTHPIGSGPFKVESFTPQSKIVLSGFKDYWGGAPKLSTLTFADIPDESARLTSLKNSEIDIDWVVSPDQVATVSGATGISLKESDSDAYFFMWFNSSQKPFTDVRVRQAMWYAVDTKAVTKSLYGSAGAPMTSPVPSSVFGSSKQKPYTYNPTKAKQLLAAAGYPNGFSTKIMLASDSAPLILEQAQAYVSYWAKVGVKVQIEAQPTAVWLQNLLALNWQMELQENFATTGDADYTLGRLYTSTANRTGYKNPTLDKYLSEAAATTDQSTRKSLYEKAGKIIWDNAVGMFPIQERDTYAVRDTVKGFVPTVTRAPSFLNVSVGN
jgi:peptide/nickel transport system substrate-binding protein